MPAQTIALIGAGRMGEALASGWLRGRTRPEIILVDPAPSPLVEAMAEEESLALNPAARPVDVALLAVKPQVFSSAADGMAPWVGPGTLVLSIMAGIRLKQLSEIFETRRVIRAMPNTPGAIGKGVSVLSVQDDVSKQDITTATRLLRPLGKVMGPVAEPSISAVTAVSGSGPAYVFLLVEALAEAGEAAGLSPELAKDLARQTLIGSARLLDVTGEDARALRKAVTSKGGTTEAALDVLMRGDGMPSLLREAVRAAADRERALSSGK
ncbi:MAG: pyrroline-5-carboxylate reductase [Pseudomonadota bacterium]